MTRRTIIAGNWKMNLGKAESIALARDVSGIECDRRHIEIIIFPATLWLAPVADAVAESGVLVGGQNCHSAVSGAFTGEVSAAMLADVCSHGLAGHSERRHVFGESDEFIAAKVRAILDANMTAVLCVGETLDERQAGDAERIVERQLREGLSQAAPHELVRVIVAYEPVWAIGTGVSATPEDAQAMCAFVRGRLGAIDSAGVDCPVLYGGSVTPENARDLLGQADIDGALVGGASLNVQSFRAIVQASRNA